MKDLRDDQLPEPEDPANVPVMGRGKYHSDYVWIVRGLESIGQTQAALAEFLGWDGPTMSRQLKGNRALKVKELKGIHRFFERHGLAVGTEPSGSNPLLTKPTDNSHTGNDDRREMEGERMLSDTIKDLGRLEDRVKALEARVAQLEIGGKGAKARPS